MKMKALTPQVRAWIYRILVAVGVLAAGYGLLTDEQVVMWLGLATAIFNIMPSANTSTKPDNNG